MMVGTSVPLGERNQRALKASCFFFLFVFFGFSFALLRATRYTFFYSSPSFFYTAHSTRWLSQYELKTCKTCSVRLAGSSVAITDEVLEKHRDNTSNIFNCTNLHCLSFVNSIIVLTFTDSNNNRVENKDDYLTIITAIKYKDPYLSFDMIRCRPVSQYCPKQSLNHSALCFAETIIYITP